MRKETSITSLHLRTEPDQVFDRREVYSTERRVVTVKVEQVESIEQGRGVVFSAAARPMRQVISEGH